MTVLRRGAPLLTALLALGFALVAVRGWHFLATPGPPWAYARDLGYAYNVTAYVQHLFHRPSDWVDALAWNPWYDIPQFYYGSLFEYAPVVAIAALSHHIWTAIKVLQVVLIAIAGSGAYALARCLRRPRRWALLAALVYASLPFVATDLHNGLAVVWPAMLLPWCLMLGVAAIRRFGEDALPLCGVLAAMCGSLPFIEFFFTVGVPAYVILCAYAYDRRSSAHRWLALALGSAPLALAPALYMLLPTLFQTVLSASGARALEVSHPVSLALFSQTPLESLALIPREQVVDPSLLVNASNVMFLAACGGAALWFFAYYAAVAELRNHRTVAVVTTIAVATACSVLALGPNLPGGALFWAAIAHLPFLGALRTPDRFLTLPALCVALAGVDGLRRFVATPPLRWGRFAWGLAIAVLWFATSLYVDGFAHRDALLLGYLVVLGLILTVAFPAAMRRRALVGAGACVLIVATSLAFDALAHVWSIEPDQAHIEPHLAAVNAIAARAGERTAAYAIARGGGYSDGSGYGVPTPQIFSVRPFGARFAQDGIGAIGLLARAGTASVIATPDWARPYEGYAPDFSTIYRSLRLGRLAFSRPDGVIVRTLPNVDAPVVADTQLCWRGGPGLLDYALAELPHVDAIDPGHRCGAELYADYTPYDALARADASTWVSGAALCPDCARLVDADAAYPVGRYELNKPWYRNAVDGDSPTFGVRGPALLIGAEGERTYRFRVAPARGRRAVALRVAAHAYAYVGIRIGAMRATVYLLPSQGLRWVTLPLRQAKCEAGCTGRLRVRLVPLGIDDQPYRWSGVALDGIAIVRRSTLDRLRAHGAPGDIVLSESAFGRSWDRRFVSRRVDVRRPWRAAATRVLLVSRSLQLTGRRPFDIAVVSHRRQATPKVAATHVPWSRSAPVTFAFATLRPGAFVAVHGARSAATTAIAREPTLPMYQPGPGKESGDLVFTEGPEALAPVYRMRGFAPDAFSPLGLTGSAGASLRVRLPGSAGPRLYAVGVRYVTGDGTIRSALRCGAHVATQATTAIQPTILTLVAAAPTCVLQLDWLGPATVGWVYVRTQLQGNVWSRRRVWLPAGQYRIAARHMDWRRLAMATVELDGRRIRGTSVVVASTGVHRFAARVPSGSHAFLLLTSQTRRRVLPRLATRRLGMLRVAADVPAATALKIDHLDDGNWVLAGRQTLTDGVPCDIVATCFQNVPAGRYEVEHRWPWYAVAGWCGTALATILPFAWLLATRPRRALGRRGAGAP